MTTFEILHRNMNLSLQSLSEDDVAKDRDVECVDHYLT
jgi:hypothetical protein